jgi:hypothetical protein
MRKTTSTLSRYLIAASIILASFCIVQIAKSAILNNGKNKKAAAARKMDQLTLKNGFRFVGGMNDQAIADGHVLKSLIYQKGNTTYVIPFKR